MKKAIGYIRISDKDQSNFSITGQQDLISTLCVKNHYELVTAFVDDGKSARNFDRPDWKKLEAFIKKSFKEVDYLVVAKYDRFSRNTAEALQMIEVIEKTYGIRIISVMEPIHVHPDSPFFFQIRAQILVGAQVEWLIIRDRTRFGNHYAAKSGRYIHKAPFGYANQRDGNNKPVIVIDEARAPVIRKMFTMFLQGAPVKEIYLEAKRAGFGNRGHSAVQRILNNPVYAGFIDVPEYGEEPGQLVKGLHEPIIDLETWHRTQEALRPKPIVRTIMNEDVPLRGVLKCFCGQPLTAGKSKGKKNYYWYYKCNNHLKFNYSCSRLHLQLEDLIKELSLPTVYIEYLKESIYRELDEKLKDQQTLFSEKKRELQVITKRIDSLEEKYLQENLDKETFLKWKNRYNDELNLCQRYITDYSQPLDETWLLYESNLPKLENLFYFYEKADLHEKQSFIRQVFNSKLYYQEGIYRTPSILPIFGLKATSLKEKRLLIIEQPLENFAEFQLCAPGGS